MSFTPADKKRINRFALHLLEYAAPKFPKFLSVEEVATDLKVSVDGITTIARAFRMLREFGHTVESVVDRDLVTYRIRPEGTTEPVIGKLSGRHSPADRSRRTLTRDGVREWALSQYPKWFTKADAAKSLDVDKNRISSLHTLLTDLRKPSRGGYKVESRCVKGGLWEYRVCPKAEEAVV